MDFKECNIDGKMRQIFLLIILVCVPCDTVLIIAPSPHTSL